MNPVTLLGFVAGTLTTLVLVVSVFVLTLMYRKRASKSLT